MLATGPVQAGGRAYHSRQTPDAVALPRKVTSSTAAARIVALAESFAAAGKALGGERNYETWALAFALYCTQHLLQGAIQHALQAQAPRT